MKKYHIKELTENQVIHAPTEEIAKKLCNRFDELGLTWYSGYSYLEFNHWKEYKEETCYRPATGYFGSKCGCKINDYEILTIDQLHDFDEPLKIEAGKLYKTRDGRKVCIYSTENGGEYPIHGAVERAGVWEVQSWKEGGKYHEEISQFHLDIVSEWEDELEFDVESLPKWRYIAMDKSGKWHLYSKKPHKDEYIFKPQEKEGEYYIHVSPKDYPKDYNGNWEDSLHKIVDGKLVKVKQ